MDNFIYLYVGNWNFHPADKGISIYKYFPEDGSLELLETIRADLAAGQLALDSRRGILYSVNECGERRDEIGGGGYIECFRIDPETGSLHFINERQTLCPEPCYIALDKSGKYLAVSHCADPFHVTRFVQNADGSWSNRVLFDDCGLVLFRLEEDGSLGEICDVSITPSEGGLGPNSKIMVDPITGHIQLTRVISRQHCVVASPGGDMLIVCDKGMDKVHSFRIDREKGKLEWLFTFDAELGCFPRYASFHPTLSVFYANNERAATVSAFSYDEKTGEMIRFQSQELLFPENYDKQFAIKDRPLGGQDVLVNPNGKALYCTLEGADNFIIVLSIAEDGSLTVRQNLDCGGDLPRGICLSPDGRFLLSGNLRSGDITTFTVDKDGLLTPTGKKYPAVSPSALKFFDPKART